MSSHVLRISRNDTVRAASIFLLSISLTNLRYYCTLPLILKWQGVLKSRCYEPLIVQPSAGWIVLYH